MKPLTGSAETVLAGPLTWRRSPPGSGHTQSKPDDLLVGKLRCVSYDSLFVGNVLDCRYVLGAEWE